jgi:long-chain acyl-CoA synthetase
MTFPLPQHESFGVPGGFDRRHVPLVGVPGRSNPTSAGRGVPAAERKKASSANPIAIANLTREDRELLERSAARNAWRFLADEYGGLRLTLDADMRRDLGVDSLDWVQLSLGMHRVAGAAIDDDAIGRIETVRDLLAAAANATVDRDGARPADPIVDPEKVLDQTRMRYLLPHGRIASKLARAMFALNRTLMRSMFNLQVQGSDRLPQAPMVIAPNHVSLLDPLAVAAALPLERLSTTYWAGCRRLLFANPMIRTISRLGHVFPIDAQCGILGGLALGSAVLKRGHDLVWFPEGARSQDGRLRPFRGGIGLLLEHHAAVVVPAAILGAYEAFPRGSWFPRRREIVVRFGNPLSCDDLRRAKGGKEPRERIASALHDAVASTMQS